MKFHGICPIFIGTIAHVHQHLVENKRTNIQPEIWLNNQGNMEQAHEYSQPTKPDRWRGTRLTSTFDSGKHFWRAITAALTCNAISWKRVERFSWTRQRNYNHARQCQIVLRAFAFLVSREKLCMYSHASAVEHLCYWCMTIRSYGNICRIS